MPPKVEESPQKLFVLAGKGREGRARRSIAQIEISRAEKMEEMDYEYMTTAGDTGGVSSGTLARIVTALTGLFWGLALVFAIVAVVLLITGGVAQGKEDSKSDDVDKAYKQHGKIMEQIVAIVGLPWEPAVGGRPAACDHKKITNYDVQHGFS